MFKLSKMLRQMGAALAVSVAAVSSHAAVTTQLGFLIDGSGSIQSSNFAIMKAGYAAALGALPTDGSIEVTVYTFSTGTTEVVAPTVVTAGSLAGIVAAINSMSFPNGVTNTAAGINDIAGAMVDSANFSTGIASIINIATDGVPCCDSNSEALALAAATAAKNLGIDALTAEAIKPPGSTADLAFLQDLVFSPLAGPAPNAGTLLSEGSTPPNPMTSNPWVLPVNSFDDFGVAINAKVQAIVNPTPEPGTLALLGIAVAGLAVGKRRAARRPNQA